MAFAWQWFWGHFACHNFTRMPWWTASPDVLKQVLNVDQGIVISGSWVGSKGPGSHPTPPNATEIPRNQAFLKGLWRDHGGFSKPLIRLRLFVGNGKRGIRVDPVDSHDEIVNLTFGRCLVDYARPAEQAVWIGGSYPPTWLMWQLNYENGWNLKTTPWKRRHWPKLPIFGFQLFILTQGCSWNL